MRMHEPVLSAAVQAAFWVASRERCGATPAAAPARVSSAFQPFLNT